MTTVAQREIANAQKDLLVGAFLRAWHIIGGPTLTREMMFSPERKWRFDFCHYGALVAIELQGGTWQQGRHTRGAGYRNDCEKLAAAQELGWLVYWLTADMLHDDPLGWGRRILATIERRVMT